MVILYSVIFNWRVLSLIDVRFLALLDVSLTGGNNGGVVDVSC